MGRDRGSSKIRAVAVVAVAVVVAVVVVVGVVVGVVAVAVRVGIRRVDRSAQAGGGHSEVLLHVRDQLSIRRMVHRLTADDLRFDRSIVVVDIRQELNFRRGRPQDEDFVEAVESACGVAKQRPQVVRMVVLGRTALRMSVNVTMGRMKGRLVEAVGLHVENASLVVIDPNCRVGGHGRSRPSYYAKRSRSNCCLPEWIMAQQDSDRSVDLPVRSLEIFERNGGRARALRVFCPTRNASTDTSDCANCPFVRAVSEANVSCTPAGVAPAPESALDGPLFLGPDALAKGTPVGAVCAAHSVAVRVDVSAARARLLLDRNPHVVVLAANDEVRGTLSGMDPAEGLTSLGELAAVGPVLRESAPLIQAIDLMVHGHMRFVAVTGEDRRFVGLISDLDVLRWVARRRTPSPR
jgi:hypothetical protein